MLTFFQISQLVGFATLMSLGQILFKKTAVTLREEEVLGLLEGVLKAITIPWFYAAIMVYGLATICWLYILQRIPLSIAYPFSALAMVIVPILAMYLFKEQIVWTYWFGMSLIILGIFVISH